ncbi:MAG: hypothetical protein M1839_006445 [Geoglossum umbratile]|nr:MAG: hypothetical protein M1839_006445 [Geoglossum umbratile]
MEQPKGEESVLAQTGYFDHVASVFRARQHPIILVEEYAMRWMGLAVVSSENIDFLIKDDQLDHIVADLLATGQYERIPQDISYRFCDPFVHFWSESLYMLTVADPKVEVPDLVAWNDNLMEDRFDPAATDVMSISYKSKLAIGCRLLPKILAQSAESNYPVYVPSVPRLVDALLNQVIYRQAHLETYNYVSILDTLPSYHLTNLIRYLHLEKPHQREKLIPELAERNRADMETRMNRYKRKPVLSLNHFASSSSQR